MTQNYSDDLALGGGQVDSLPVTECPDSISKQTLSDVNIGGKQNHVVRACSHNTSEIALQTSEHYQNTNQYNCPANSSIEETAFMPQPSVNGISHVFEHDKPNEINNGLDDSSPYSCVAEIPHDLFKNKIGTSNTLKSNLITNFSDVNEDSQLSSISSKFLPNHTDPDCGSRDSFTQSDVEPSDLRKELLAALTRQQTSTPDSDVHSFATTASFEDAVNENTVESVKSEKIDSSEDENDERESLGYELNIGLRILKEFLVEANKSLTWPFLNAVDPERDGVEDYYEKVPSPMWFNKMKENFLNHKYTSITEFVSDFRMMLENCYRYNGPDHPISKKAQRLETMLEQKLSLLSRDLREKTSIAASAGLSLEEKKITGTRRRKVLVPHDSTALLNQLRLEQLERGKEARRLQMLERRQQHEAELREVDNWEDQLLQGSSGVMRHCWEIPQIGHFLFLCMGALNIGEVMHFELERCFAMPRESLTMQKVMTTLLSTPHQRTRLNRKPMMPYKVWEEKIRVRMRHWYKVLKDCHLDLTKTCNKLGFDEKFFKVLGLRSPMERNKYHELSFYQRVWIMKALCDWCLENQESLREAIECQLETEQRSYHLGTDAKGNTYINFPQFCGADVRIYRHAPVEMPTLDIPPQPKKTSNRKRQSKSRSLSKKALALARQIKQRSESAIIEKPKEPRDSRLRKNPRQMQTYAEMDSTTEDSTVTGGEEEEEEEEQEEGENESEAKEFPNSEVDSGISESESEEPPVKKPSRSSRNSALSRPTRSSSRQSARRESARRSPSPSHSMGEGRQQSAAASSPPVSGRVTRSAWKKCIEDSSTPTNSRASTPVNSTALPSRTASRNSTPVEFELGRNTPRSRRGRRKGGRGHSNKAEDDRDDSVLMDDIKTQADSLVISDTRTKEDDLVSEIKSEPCETRHDSADEEQTVSSSGKSCDIKVLGGEGDRQSPMEDVSLPPSVNKINREDRENSSCDKDTNCDDITSVCDTHQSAKPDRLDTLIKEENMSDICDDSADRNLSCGNSNRNSPVESIGFGNVDEKSCDTEKMRSQLPTASDHNPVQVKEALVGKLKAKDCDTEPCDERGRSFGDSTSLLPSGRNRDPTCVGSSGDHKPKKAPDTDNDSDVTLSDFRDESNRNKAELSDEEDENEDMEEIKTTVDRGDTKDELSVNKADVSGLDLLLAAAEKDMTSASEPERHSQPGEVQVKQEGSQAVDESVQSMSAEDREECMDTTQAGSKLTSTVTGNGTSDSSHIKPKGDVHAEENSDVIKVKSEDEVKVEKPEEDGMIRPVQVKVEAVDETLDGQEVDGMKEEGDSGVKKEGQEAEVKMESMEIKEELDDDFDEEPEIVGPEACEFKLVVDSVESLRRLAEEFGESPPIVTGSGKREKVVPGSPRKRCERELASRLLFLLKELEPWEHKLTSAQRRAKLRMKKEKENYVEEPEREQMDFWVSEHELSSDEEDFDKKSEASGYDAYSSVSHQEAGRMNTRSGGRRDRKKLGQEVKEEEGQQDVYMEQTEEYGISSKGRIRKRRVIPNNVEDQSLQPKKTKSTPRHERPALLSKGGKSSSSSTTPVSAGSTQETKLRLPHLTGAAAGAAMGSSRSVPTSSATANQTLFIRSPGAGSLQGGKQYIQISGNLALRNPAVLSQLLAGQGNAGQQIVVQGNPGQDTQKLVQAILAHRKQQQSVGKTTVFEPFQFKTGEARNQQQSSVASNTPQQNLTSLQSLNSTANLLSQQTNPLQLFQQSVPTCQAKQVPTVQAMTSREQTNQLGNQNLSIKLQQPTAALSTPALSTAQNVPMVIAQSQAVIPPLNVMTSPQKVTQVARIMTSQGVRTIPLSQLPSPIIAQLSKLQSGQNIRLQLTAAASTSLAQTAMQQQQQTFQQPTVVATPTLNPGGPMTVASASGTLPSQQSAIRPIPSPVKSPRQEVYVSTAEPTLNRMVEIQLTSSAAVGTGTSVNPAIMSSDTAARTIHKYAAGVTVKELLAHSNRTSTTRMTDVAYQQTPESTLATQGSSTTESTEQQGAVESTTQSSQMIVLQDRSTTQAEEPMASAAAQSQPTIKVADTKMVLKSGQKIAVLKKTAHGTQQVMMDASNLQMLLAKKQAIDQAVKKVVTEAPTTLPTANIKVSSPFTMPTRQPHRPCTIATSSMKHPIPSVFPLAPGGSDSSKQSSPDTPEDQCSTITIVSPLPESPLKAQTVLASPSETIVKLVPSNSISSVPSSAVRVISTETLSLNRTSSKATNLVMATTISNVQAIAPQPVKVTSSCTASPTKVIASNTAKLMIQPQGQGTSQVVGVPQRTLMLQRQVINTPQGPVQGVILPQNIVGGGLIQKTKDGLVLMQKPAEQVSGQTTPQQSLAKSSSGVVIAQGTSHISGTPTAINSSKVQTTSESVNKFRAITMAASTGNVASVSSSVHHLSSSASNQQLTTISQVTGNAGSSLTESVKAIQPKIQLQIAPQQQSQQPQPQLLLQQPQQLLTTSPNLTSVQPGTSLQPGVVNLQQPRMVLVNVNGQLMAQAVAPQLKVAQVGQQNLSSLAGVQLAQLNQASNQGLAVLGGTRVVHTSNTQANASSIQASQGTSTAQPTNPGLALLSGAQLLGSNVQLAQVNQQQVAIVGATQLAQGGNPGTPLMLATPQLMQQQQQQLGMLQQAQFQIQTPQGPMAVINSGGQAVIQQQTQQPAIQLQQASASLVQNAFSQHQTASVQQNMTALVQPQLVQGQTQQAMVSVAGANPALKQLQLVTGNPAAVLQLHTTAVTSSH